MQALCGTALADLQERDRVYDPSNLCALATHYGSEIGPPTGSFAQNV
jgi:hypothetical protein